MGTRRVFSREYKLEAVKLVTDRGVAVAQAARDLGLHENVLRKWVKEQRSDPQQAFPGHGQMKPEAAELERLRKEVQKLRIERDILKKPRPTSPGNRCEVRFRGEAPRGLGTCGSCARRSVCLGAGTTAGWRARAASVSVTTK